MGDVKFTSTGWLRPARLRPPDIIRLGVAGLRARPVRVLLSALGVAIGVTAMTVIVGISMSSRAELDRRLDALGTNLLRVAPGQTLGGERAQLPEASVAMIARVPPVISVAATGLIDANVYRNDHIPVGRTGSIAVLAAEPDLLHTVGATMRTGSWFNAATARLPVVVLGAQAAARLDIYAPGVRLWLGGIWCSLVGVLKSVPLAPELDSAALVSWSAAKTYLGFDLRPNTIYVRTVESQVTAVHAVLGRTANPENPGEVQVSRPSDALAAKATTDTTVTGLLLGLGAVALLVGGVGVGNTMVISVFERRSEIGLRRSLGATRAQIRHQFLAESLLLAAIGGGAGVLLGIVMTSAYAIVKGWPTVVPAWVSLAGLGCTIMIGALAGLYPAARASRLAPTEALATT